MENWGRYLGLVSRRASHVQSILSESRLAYAPGAICNHNLFVMLQIGCPKKKIRAMRMTSTSRQALSKSRHAVRGKSCGRSAACRRVDQHSLEAAEGGRESLPPIPDETVGGERERIEAMIYAWPGGYGAKIDERPRLGPRGRTRSGPPG